MTFKSMITKLNKAYNALKRQGQEFMEKSKVEQLAKQIKNPSRDAQIKNPSRDAQIKNLSRDAQIKNPSRDAQIKNPSRDAQIKNPSRDTHIKNPSRDAQIMVAVETMREAYKANYTAVTQYITAQMAQINSASINAPGGGGIILIRCLRPAQLISRETNSIELMFATPGENSPTMNGSTSLDNTVKSSTEQSAALTGAEAMEAKDVDEAVAVVAKAAVTGTMVEAEVAETKMPLATTNKR